jgi:hypothetical protein
MITGLPVIHNPSFTNTLFEVMIISVTLSIVTVLSDAFYSLHSRGLSRRSGALLARALHPTMIR